MLLKRPSAVALSYLSVRLFGALHGAAVPDREAVAINRSSPIAAWSCRVRAIVVCFPSGSRCRNGCPERHPDPRTLRGPPSSLVQLRIAVWTGVTRDTRPGPELMAPNSANRREKSACFALAIASIAGAAPGISSRLVPAVQRGRLHADASGPA